MIRLVDMHCHLDFAGNAVKAARAAEAAGVAMYSCMVHPAGYDEQVERLAECENVRVGLGLHPWWVADGRADDADVAGMVSRISDVRYVGEVGLDFGKRHGRRIDAQEAAFTAVARACAESGGKLLSIHAVKSADAVLDILEQTGCLEANDCILHWFSGTSQELTRAVRAGCWFSLGAPMLSTKRGRAYAKAIPNDRLLLETDWPGDPVADMDIEDYLAKAEESAGLVRDILGEDALARAAESSLRLLDM
ncbi:Uncharacterized deoxyribonuclease YcfH [Slackia heliotrinireducens]|uniref:Mg-dependent DNase n=1 Tax=Slackia heliotrinireducens (strain ATCC 29202 / DSM 20476 / NCTC 11029 / RHS 1) TaxID=471855 RepID=C7N183_SLAHD|nr:TatD family hydrolase [Slackia heliotrinireducens]ACV23305.1 Mg-dependent DNase [Slackia heliotrinireducens DSM 20476]VEH02494.1 Uncharacterized deoxyribonuclease YcfH [Slackia heliotrinireducens]